MRSRRAPRSCSSSCSSAPSTCSPRPPSGGWPTPSCGAGDGAVPALPRGDRADVGVGALGGGGGLPVRARRRPARARPRLAGRRRCSGWRPPSSSRRRRCWCRRCSAGGPRPPASSPASSRRSSSRTCRTCVTGGAFGSLFESGSAWTGGSLLFTLLARLITPEVAALAVRWRSSPAAPCGSPGASAGARGPPRPSPGR